MPKITVNCDIDINNLGGGVTVAVLAIATQGTPCALRRKTKTGAPETIADPAAIGQKYPAGIAADLVNKRAVYCVGRIFKHTANQFRVYLRFEQDGHWVADSDPVEGQFSGPTQDFQINCFMK